MKKYFFTITFLLISMKINISFADELNCEIKSGFDKYQCRVERICKEYVKNDEKNKYQPVIITTEYSEANDNYGIDEIKEMYRENMNNIYSCGILKSQKIALNNLVKRLLKEDSSGELGEKLIQPTESRINKIELSAKALKCKFFGGDEVYNKEFVLRQTTYELCKHSIYLEYLKEYKGVLRNNIKSGETNKSFSISNMLEKKENIESEINEEIEHSFKVFSVVFHAYSEYENNFPIHVMLELIRDDFATFRNKLYKTISPINQLVYKISNAMSIH